MYVTKEFCVYGPVIRSTCALRTALLQFTWSPHVGKCVFGIPIDYPHFWVQKLLATDTHRQHVEV
jgi:hypothetical protein